MWKRVRFLYDAENVNVSQKKGSIRNTFDETVTLNPKISQHGGFFTQRFSFLFYLPWITAHNLFFHTFIINGYIGYVQLFMSLGFLQFQASPNINPLYISYHSLRAGVGNLRRNLNALLAAEYGVQKVN